MNSRRMGAQRLPGACCKPFPSPPQLHPVKSPCVSSRAANRRSHLLPEQPCSVACSLCGLHLPLLWDPHWGWGAPKLSTLSWLSAPELPMQRDAQETFFCGAGLQTRWPSQGPASFLAKEAQRSTCRQLPILGLDPKPTSQVPELPLLSRAGR